MPRVNAPDVILELIRCAPDGEWTGKTKLYKAFYFAHLYYAQKQPGILTNHPIARMPEGPGISDGDELLNKLADEGCLTVEMVPEGPYPEYRYTLTEKADSEQRLPEDAREAIRASAAYALPKLAGELSAITHDRSRSWREGSDGDILDIYIDILPDQEYKQEQLKLAVLNRALEKALRG